MAAKDDDAQDAITAEEISGTAPAPAPAPATSGTSQGAERNAFTELMAPKPARAQTQTQTQTQTPRDIPGPSFLTRQALAATRGPLTRSFKNRDGLGAYTHDPAAFPASRVVFYDDDFVAIRDMYPKSSLHCLLLPRAPRSRLHPFDAFGCAADDGSPTPDAAEAARFLAAVRGATARLARLVAAELRRRHGRGSAAERARQAVLDGSDDPDQQLLPPGRDWEAELLVGVHAHPSMNDLHVHVLAPDMVSECMRHRKHYNSFRTPFLIGLDAFPLAPDDPRRHPGRAGYLDTDLRCWRCGRSFGNRFKQLKDHLADEFELWKSE
ncbi:HIT-like protein [Durotheca rogersii]|uniref:HIT-like protein n=1 Tax=Durotheca rogersii TaxID=419775 RepID=UPI00222012B3|nr:HIT-like protein [Durotheca rogersii]KAI5862947.1 HIT-like protein [Durotheca rogersii]